ncbi:hypothetical protein DPMN_063629 [Dreissena polymorpha]|uniref:Uncharacterized protein n=1 Tax=Dreissena polymorpha TaxID=45954 RepID=A0A9D4HIS1_DREPO|nr:hypothetical protein DPMN_063629 [Dreissena polymorpha]
MSKPLFITNINLEEGTDKEMGKDEGLEQAIGPVNVTDTNLGLSLSGLLASYVKSADAKAGNQGVRPKVAQHTPKEGWYQGKGLSTIGLWHLRQCQWTRNLYTSRLQLSLRCK